MPLETGGKHWVSLAITKDKDGKMVFTYNDPIGTSIDASPDLVQMINEMAPMAQIVDLRTKQQRNNVDCGPFVVDNLVKMATGQPILDTQQSQNAGARLRAEHSLAISANQAAEHAASIKQSIVRGGTVVSQSFSRVPSSNSSVSGRGR
jgi:Ulp1 family protease